MVSQMGSEVNLTTQNFRDAPVTHDGRRLRDVSVFKIVKGYFDRKKWKGGFWEQTNTGPEEWHHRPFRWCLLCREVIVIIIWFVLLSKNASLPKWQILQYKSKPSQRKLLNEVVTSTTNARVLSYVKSYLFVWLRKERLRYCTQLFFWDKSRNGAIVRDESGHW